MSPYHFPDKGHGMVASPEAGLGPSTGSTKIKYERYDNYNFSTKSFAKNKIIGWLAFR
jgi:hypothetical protein